MEDITPEEELLIKQYVERYNLNKSAAKEFARSLTEEAIERRESFGVTTDLIKLGKHAPLDSLQLQNTVHSAVMAKLNKDTVRVKFKGGQFVVSASMDFIKSYRIPGSLDTTRALQRDEYMKSDKVKLEKLDKESLKNFIPNDPVWVAGVESPLWKVQDTPEFKRALANGLVQGKILPEPETLQWMSYINKDGKSIEDFEAYKQLLVETDPERRTQLEIQLTDILEDPSHGWSTNDAEFYMPQMHKAAYNLEDGDSLLDIMGDYEEGSEEERKTMIKFFTTRIEKNHEKS